MLSVVTPAPDPNLLTIAEMRALAGLAAGDASRDAELAALNSRASRAVAAYCLVAHAGASVLTLRSEELSEVIRSSRCRHDIVLSRRPVTSISSIIEGGVVLPSADYEVDQSSGILTRLSNGEVSSWTCSKLTVNYIAGWPTPPDDLKLAASKLANEALVTGSRDPNLKRIFVPGVVEKDFWVSPKDDPLMSGEVQALLGPYMNIWVA